MPDIIARITPSAPRRAFGAGALGLLGLMLIYIAVARPPDELGWLAFLVGLGGGSLWLAQRYWEATSSAIELTEGEVRESTGRVICRVEDIVSVDRGVFAFKPSNGFLLTTKKRAPRSWSPGLWWRIGRRVGVGGVTSRHECKFFAETLAGMIKADSKR